MTHSPSSNSEQGLRIEGLKFGYPKSAPVIDGYDLEVARGTVHCVLGPSGAGKTTLLRLIAGLERAQDGRISVGGVLVAHLREHHPPERRRVGMVFQDYALFSNRTVQGNVLFGIGNGTRKQRIQEANKLLERVGISELANRMPHTLSGGQQQRVALARALARQPSVMLLDEPFSSLDMETRSQIRLETIAMLRDAHVATVMVTHDPNEAEIVADKISWLRVTEDA